jgi:hypothetical protein
VFDIAGGGQQRQLVVVGDVTQMVHGLLPARLAQFDEVAAAELGEAAGFVAVPAAQFPTT